jgi:nucleotide-binding universal stress UspA family protein
VSEEVALQAANAYLREIANRLRATPAKHARLEITATAELDFDSAEHILETAQPELETGGVAAPAQGYDIIVMATHGRTGVLRWTVGSITERVMQMAKTPMLIVRPASQENQSFM